VDGDDWNDISTDMVDAKNVGAARVGLVCSVASDIKFTVVKVDNKFFN
jgi:hypothetical protein